jgi:LacI family transcriptional regulator
MKKIEAKIRIKDIATLAGVSEGTVDRVLHNRGEVSVKSRDAVTKVLEEMNYTPNLFARSLASKKQYRFVCLFPAHQPGEYWERVDKGFDLAAHDFLHHNVQIDKQYFNQFDVNSFICVSESIIENLPDAVFVAPIFREETSKFSFIDSMIEDTEYITYYGQNSFLSGYIAAKLLLNSLPDRSQVIVIRTKRKGAVSNQTIARNNGFLHYIKENKLDEHIELINVEFRDDDENENLQTLRNVFAENPNIKAAITFNSKVHRLAMHLATLECSYVRLIGYDLLTQNVEFLKQGVISYLIAQRPDKQAYYSVRDMCRELIFRQEIKKVNYVPIDILMKENIEDYMYFIE